jgi:predicted alpha-1,2-mannosidase
MNSNENQPINHELLIPKIIMKQSFLPCFAFRLVLAAAACSNTWAKDPVDSVNPFIGTGGDMQHNHAGSTSPAAVLPFGMISPGADTGEGPGYVYGSNQIRRFSHTRLSGVGAQAYLQVKLMPTTGNKEVGSPQSYSRFSHDNETAAPGYYRVLLSDYQIDAEVTCTKRAAIHRYTFPSSDSARILLPNHTVTQVSDTEIQGYDRSDAFGPNDTYFCMIFSKPFSSFKSVPEGAYVSYSTVAGEKIQVRVGISYVSSEQAKLNLEKEIPDWNFDGVRAAARAEWNKNLGRIEIAGGTGAQQTIFYTALYHALWHPQLESDVNGQYRGMDGKVHTADHGVYTVLPMWDAFRAKFPLLLLIRPDVQLDVVKTIIDDFKQTGQTPIWKLAYKETNCMIGTHSDPVIVDAYAKGLRDFDINAGWDAVANDGNNRRGGHYIQKGYVPYDLEWASVSRTLEYAYDDFCIAQLAGALGKPDDEKTFSARAENYRNVYNLGFMRPRAANGDFLQLAPENANESSKLGMSYVEGNAWQWTWSVMHDMQGLMNLMGGDRKFEATLDNLFTAPPPVDMGSWTGEIGEFMPSNEPSSHIPYLYNYCGKPWKTQKWVRVAADLFKDAPDGIFGEDDCGHMSAWYVFSASGFYPVTPGVPEYNLGSPLFSRITWHLPGGDFVVTSKDVSAANPYIQSATLNGKNWDKTYLPHSAIAHGGTLMLKMGASHDSGWGTASNARPYSLTRGVGAEIKK